MDEPQELKAMRAAALVYAAGLVLHTVDHFRRGMDAVTPQVGWLGTFGLVAGAVALVLVAAGSRRAAEAAVAVGIPKAVGVSAVHLLPAWGAFSDSFIGTAMHPVSWAAVLLEIAGALALGVTGLRALSRRPTVEVSA